MTQKLREGLVRPFALNIQSKQPGLMRALGASEVKVHVFTSAGHFAQIKIGSLNSRGECFVRFEGENVQATLEGKRWTYRIPPIEVRDDD